MSNNLFFIFPFLFTFDCWLACMYSMCVLGVLVFPFSTKHHEGKKILPFLNELYVNIVVENKKKNICCTPSFFVTWNDEENNIHEYQWCWQSWFYLPFLNKGFWCLMVFFFICLFVCIVFDLLEVSWGQGKAKKKWEGLILTTSPRSLQQHCHSLRPGNSLRHNL